MTPIRVRLIVEADVDPSLLSRPSPNAPDPDARAVAQATAQAVVQFLKSSNPVIDARVMTLPDMWLQNDPSKILIPKFGGVIPS